MNIVKKIIGKPQKVGLQKELSRNRYYNIISNALKFIHQQIPMENFDTQRAAAPTHIREEIFNGCNYSRAVIFLMSNGCEWALKSAHGCTMCGHLGKQARKSEVISSEDFIRQFSGEFKRIDFKKNPLLNIFNNGSFLNDREIPRDARVEILKAVNANPDIKMLVVESRPEFITEEKVKEIKKHVPGKHVEIAVGLELKDDFYRRLCINKGFSLKTYNKAARIITKHLHLRTYVFLKPPFLTEMESIEAVVETTDHAFNQGSSTVSLEACTIQDFTLTRYMFDWGIYRPPWLWSIIESIKRSKAAKKLIVGLFQFHPTPSLIPYNCPRCSESVMAAMSQYNRTLDVKALDVEECQCKEEWMKVLKAQPQPLEERLEQFVRQLNQHFVCCARN